ncbi:MAG: hypothetical protein ACRDHW_04665 [Ktedonobacteraceae bacterium]
MYGSIQQACEQTVRMGERTVPDPAHKKIYERAYETYCALYPALKPILSHPLS